MYHSKLKWKLFPFRNLSQELLKSYAMLRGIHVADKNFEIRHFYFCKAKYMIANRIIIEICKQGSILCLINTTTCKNSAHLSLHTHVTLRNPHKTYRNTYRECKNRSQNALHGNQSHID